jgi:putative peptidoglycan lipid II flippase
MLKKSFGVTVIFGLSTLVQLISQIFITRIFGASKDVDVFLSAVTIPTILVTIIYSTLNNILVPFMGSEKGKMPNVLKLVKNLGGLSILFTLLVIVFSYNISDILFGQRGQDFVSEVSKMMNILMLGIPIAVIATVLGAWHYFQKNVLRFPITQLLGGISNVLIVLFFSRFIGVYSLVLGFIINLFIQIFFIWPKNHKKDYLMEIRILPLVLAWLPLLVGEFFLRSDSILIRTYGAQMPEGALVHLNLVYRIYSLVAGVTTIGLQIVLLSHLVDHIRSGKYNEAERIINKAKISALIITSFIVLFILLIGPFLIKLLFEGGKFTAEDSLQTSRLLPYFVIPALGWGLSGVFFQPLYALKKYNELALINGVGFLIAIVISYFTNLSFGPTQAITNGLIALLFTGIIGSEFLWQYHRKNLKKILYQL